MIMDFVRRGLARTIALAAPMSGPVGAKRGAPAGSIVDPREPRPEEIGSEASLPPPGS